MKQILLLFTAVLFIGCSSDDPETCSCMGAWGDIDEVLYTQETEIYCNTGEPVTNPTGDPMAGFKGCQE